jgi:hypothetical protein
LKAIRIMHALRIPLLVLAGASLACAQAAPSPLPERVEFNRDIRPILAGNCLKCHGQDEKRRKGDLRLDTREGALAEREGRPAVVPGKPGASELIRRVTAADESERMPPSKSGKRLGERETALLRRWIEQGAEWQGHWAFLPPQRPPLPRVRDASWARTPLDSFILARLEAEGLRPSPEADRVTLARRLALDLTGLPPTPVEVDAFVQDSSPDALERLVDRLLASPRHGEHMARYWLDLARYGDTHGLHLDNYREIWPYRDWVIRAFNDNLPFDRFVTEQLAGDLLPPPSQAEGPWETLDPQVASGFNRCHVTTSEGGSIEEEVYCRNVFDRVETFGQVFMALTFTCSRCHDHKYDPITQKDYYGLFALFNSLDGSELDGNKKDPAPVVKVPAPAEKAELTRLDAEIRKVENRMNGPLAEVDAAQQRWEKDLAARLRAQWAALDVHSFKATGEAALSEQPDKSVAAGGHRLVYEVTARAAAASHALRLEVLPPVPPPAGETAIAFSLSEVEAELMGTDGTRTPVDLHAARAVAPQPDPAVANLIDGKPQTAWTGDARKSPAVVLLAKSSFGPGELRVRLAHEGDHARQPVPRFRISATPDEGLLRGIAPSTRGPWLRLGLLPAADGKTAYRTDFGPEQGVDPAKAHGELLWTPVADPGDKKPFALPEGVGATYLTRVITSPSPRKMTILLGSDDAVRVWLNGRAVLSKDVQRKFKQDEDKVEIGLESGENRLLFKVANYGTAGSRFSFEIASEETADFLADVAAALEAPAGKRNDAQKALLRTRYRRDHWPEWRALSGRLADLRAAEKSILDVLPTSLVFKERGAPRDAYILKRGEYDKRGDKVGRGTPASLPPLPPGAPLDRLGLARWLLSPTHPLTARVAVNRFWQQLFGTGLVKTSEDFGLQGEPPSHPELLDWMAVQFVEDGWDVKRFMRRLVTSAAYRQTSRVTPELLHRDPDNRLLARGPRFRLDAEMMRDQALFLSGLLVEKVGGPSVKPPQPDGLWEAVGYTGSNTYRFARDPAEKVFRRSLYIFWKRTSAPPMMTLFDAPSRESCIARRERTNTPLQALLLMNEPQFVESARHLAQRALKEGGRSPEERAAWLVRQAALRPASPDDVADLVGVYRAQRAIFDRDPDAAGKAVAFGDLPPDPSAEPAELASWMMVAGVVLNLDEVLNKR